MTRTPLDSSPGRGVPGVDSSWVLVGPFSRTGHCGKKGGKSPLGDGRGSVGVDGEHTDDGVSEEQVSDTGTPTGHRYVRSTVARSHTGDTVGKTTPVVVTDTSTPRTLPTRREECHTIRGRGVLSVLPRPTSGPLRTPPDPSRPLGPVLSSPSRRGPTGTREGASLNTVDGCSLTPTLDHRGMGEARRTTTRDRVSEETIHNLRGYTTAPVPETTITLLPSFEDRLLGPWGERPEVQDPKVKGRRNQV